MEQRGEPHGTGEDEVGGEGSTGGAWSAELGHMVYALQMKAGYSYEIAAQLQAGNGGVGNGTVSGALSTDQTPAVRM